MSARIIRRSLLATPPSLALGVRVATAAAGDKRRQAPGGPVLVVTDPADPFGQYYAEILRAEGLNEFGPNVGPLNAQTLAGLPGRRARADDSPPPQAPTLTTWVSGGGNLIAMRPDAELAGLLGLGATSGDSRQRATCRRHRPAPGAASRARRCSSTAPPTAGRAQARRRRDALLGREHRDARARR